jgi:hypothetical protein
VTGLPDVLESVRALATGRRQRHPTLLSALCWREVGAGPAMRWRDGRLVDLCAGADEPAADEATLALPRRIDDVGLGARRFMERVEELVPDRRGVLALIGGADLVVPTDPPVLRIPFEAEAAEIGACAIAARCLFLCGPWLVESAGPPGEVRKRVAASLYLAGVVAERAGVVDAAVDAAGHVAVTVFDDPGLRVWGRGRAVEFAGRV